jgi:hypothetical protein
VPILIRDPDGPYYSSGDERAFFEWVQRISCVAKVEGSGSELRIHVRRRRISDTCLRELLALFHRYGVSMQQLVQFESPSNRHWFRDPIMYWHKAVFEVPQPRVKPVRASGRALPTGRKHSGNDRNSR